MQITAIEEKRKGLSAVYIDGEYAMKLDTFALAKSGVKVGSEIDDDRLHEIVIESNLSRAKEKALYLLEYRSRSRNELVEKIKPLYGDDAAEAAADKMVQLGLVDDEKFARDFAEELFHRKKYAPKRVGYELLRKGIDREIIDEVIEELTPDPEEQIRSLLETKFRNKLGDIKSRRKTANALAALGYSYYDINSVLSEYEDE